jgi:hypothetical protein
VSVFYSTIFLIAISPLYHKNAKKLLGIREKVLLQYRLREIEYTKFAKKLFCKIRARDWSRAGGVPGG